MDQATVPYGATAVDPEAPAHQYPTLVRAALIISILGTTFLLSLGSVARASVWGWARPEADADNGLVGTTSVYVPCTAVRFAGKEAVLSFSKSCGCDPMEAMNMTDDSGFMVDAKCNGVMLSTTKVFNRSPVAGGALLHPPNPEVEDAIKAGMANTTERNPNFDGYRISCTDLQADDLQSAQTVAAQCGCDPEQAQERPVAGRVTPDAGFMVGPECKRDVFMDFHFHVRDHLFVPAFLPYARIAVYDVRHATLQASKDFALAAECDPSTSHLVSDGSGYATSPACDNIMLMAHNTVGASDLSAPSRRRLAAAGEAREEANDSTVPGDEADNGDGDVGITELPQAPFTALCTAFRFNTVDGAKTSQTSTACGCDPDKVTLTNSGGVGQAGSAYMMDPTCRSSIQIGYSFFQFSSA